MFKLIDYRILVTYQTRVSIVQVNAKKVYGHDAILPWEIKTGSRHVAFQEDLTANDYKSLMNDDL